MGMLVQPVPAVGWQLEEAHPALQDRDALQDRESLGAGGEQVTRRNSCSLQVWNDAADRVLCQPPQICDRGSHCSARFSRVENSQQLLGGNLRSLGGEGTHESLRIEELVEETEVQ